MIVFLLFVIIALLGLIAVRLGQQNEANKDMAKAYRTLAASLAKEAKGTLADVAAAVEKGVTDTAHVAAQLAATNAASNPLSDPKIPKPALPPE